MNFLLQFDIFTDIIFGKQPVYLNVNEMVDVINKGD